MSNDSDETVTAAEYRRRGEEARAQARARYREHLIAVFTQRGIDEPGTVADTALDALTEWRYTDSGERCRCSCHPSLPATDFHDFGFDCRCIQTPQRREGAFQRFLAGMEEFWQSPEGQQIQAANQAAEMELQAWLADQPNVVIHRHGGMVPEQWEGQVDGHRFYFRERGGDWDIELNLRMEQHNITRGDLIATGTTAAEGYGESPRERAMFIVTSIRDHLRRQACAHPRLDAVAAVLGVAPRWCPECGTRVDADRQAPAADAAEMAAERSTQRNQRPG